MVRKLVKLGLLTIVAMVVTMSVSIGHAANPESDFKFDAATGTITGLADKYATLGSEPATIDIPEKIGNVAVKHIGAKAFEYRSNIRTLTIPASVETIGNYAFWHSTKISTINLKAGLKTIGTQAFYNLDALTRITVPDGVTTIYSYAFAECDILQQASLPNSVTYMDQCVFYNCKQLQTANLPNALTTLGTHTFYNCYKLTSMNVPNMPGGRLPNYTFYNCLALSSVTLPNTLTTIGVDCFYNNQKLTRVTLPTSVKTLEQYAFRSCSNLSNVNLTSLTTLGYGAFYGCGFTSLTVPANITSISSYCWYGNGRLTSVNFQAGTSYVPDMAFYGCSALRTVTLKNTITEIRQYAFCNCYALTTINIPSGVTVIGNYAFHGDYSLQQSCVNTLPSALKTIGVLAFYNCDGITSITIPNSVETIDNYAFQDCSGLRTVNIGSGLKNWKTSIFLWVPNIQTITMSSSNPNFVQDSGNGIIYNKARTELMYYPRSLTATSFTIPNTVTKIHSNAFYYINSLRSIIIPTSVKVIEEYNFVNMGNLEVCRLPESVTTLGQFYCWDSDKLTEGYIPSTITNITAPCFGNCSGIKEIVCSLDNNYYASFEGILYTKDLKTLMTVPTSYTGELVIMPGVEVIATYSIAYCQGITRIILPESLKTIKHSAFRYCLITEIDLPLGVTSIESEAFLGCEYLTRISLPDKLKTISNYCFQNCTRLTEVDTPINLTTIGYAAFYNCPSLTHIQIPSTCTSIDVNSFGACTSMVKIMIDKDTDTIANKPWGATNATVVWGTPANYFTFSGQYITGFSQTYYNERYKPTDLRFPKYTSSNVEIIGIAEGAFDPTKKPTQYRKYYEDVRSVTLQNTLVELQKGAFMNAVGLKRIQFRRDLSTERWFFEKVGESAFEGCASLLQFDPGYTGSSGPIMSFKTIGDRAFYGCSTLEALTIPTTLETIGSKAFYENYSMKTLTFPTAANKLKSIGTFAFQKCSGFTTVNMSKCTGLTVIDVGTFQACKSLTTVNLPTTIKKIEASAFAGCYDKASKVGLKTINLPAGLQSLGRSSFTNCAALPKIVIPSGVTEIPESCFSGCTVMTVCDLPNTIRVIGESAFKDCESLISSGNENEPFPQYPATETTAAFTGFSSGFKIPDGVQRIEAFTFANCPAMQRMFIPESVTYISPYVTQKNPATGLVDVMSGTYTSDHLVGFTIYIDTYSHGIPDESTSNKPWGAGTTTDVIWLKTLHPPYTLLPPYTSKDPQTGNTIEYRGVNYPKANQIPYGAVIKLGTDSASVGGKIVYHLCSEITGEETIEDKSWSGRINYNGNNNPKLYDRTFFIGITEGYSTSYSNRTMQLFTILPPNKPVCTPSESDVPDNTVVTLLSDSELNPGKMAEDIVIYYTLDGSDPAESPTRKVYDPNNKPVLTIAGANPITRGITLRAIAVQGQNRLGDKAKVSDELIWDYEVGIPKVDPNVKYTDYVITPENRHMIGYQAGVTRQIFIPAVFKYNGVNYKVVGIGESAFAGEQNLFELYIPETVASIGYYAFAGTSLDYATIRSDCETIANSAFEGCTRLKTFNMIKDEESILGGPWGAPNNPDIYWFGDGGYLTSIEIVTPPDKVDYIEGQRFNTTGMVVRANYQNGTSKLVRGWTVRETKALGLDDIKRTIVYTENGRTRMTSQLISVTNPIVTLEISSMPAKSIYEWGDTLDLTGMTVKAVYESGKTVIVDGWEVAGSQTLTKVGTVTLNVTYEERGVEVGTTLKITVLNPLTKFEVASLPTKVDYYSGEDFERDGLALKATYKNGDTSFVALDDVTCILEGETDMPVTTTGITATYTYEGKTMQVKIPINVYSSLSYFNYTADRITGMSVIWDRLSAEEKAVAIKVPSKFTMVVEGAFEGKGIVNIEFSDSMKNIGVDAFKNCKSLVSCTLGDSVTYIGKGAFNGCSAMKILNIPASTTYIGADALTGTTANILINNRSGAIYGAPWGASGTIRYLG